MGESRPKRSKSAGATGPQDEHEHEALANVGRRYLDFASEGIILLSRQGRISEINSAAMALLQCSSSACGSDFWDAVPRQVAEKFQAPTSKALAVAGEYGFTAHHTFEDSWLKYDIRGYPDGFVVNIRDVTVAQKFQRLAERSERHNQIIFSASPNAMWIFDAGSLRILAVNDAAVEFYGLSRKTLLKSKMGALFPDGEGASLLSALAAVSSDNDQLSPQLCKQRKVDGELVLAELACGRLRWDEQKAVLVALTDLTDRHLADRTLRRESDDLQEQLAAALSELDTTQRDLAAFTYALSNDLQAPLHAANGFATMLADRYSDALDTSGLHYVHRIQASTRQLARLVDDLRALVQLPAISGQPEAFNLTQVCTGVIADLRKHHPDRTVTVEMDAGVTLVADRSLVVRAIAALLDNAWKFTSKKPEAWIKLALLPGQDGAEVVLQVSDNGTGFDLAYAGKLFTAFERLHSSADFPGHGLGLAIVKKVADRHGGRVWAESTSRGASFFVSFPQVKVAHPV